jgi:hypothetical protein
MNRRTFMQGNMAALALSAARRYEAQTDLLPIRVGLIGCGWNGKSDTFRLVQVAVEIVSLCDVDRKMMADCADMAAARQSSRKKPRMFTDYREMLKRRTSTLVEIPHRGSRVRHLYLRVGQNFSGATRFTRNRSLR